MAGKGRNALAHAGLLGWGAECVEPWQGYGELPDGPPLHMSVGGQWMCAAVSRTGHAYVWGRCTHGRLGMGSARTEIAVPTRVPGIANARAVVVTDAHTVWLCGTAELLVVGGGYGAGIGGPLRFAFPPGARDTAMPFRIEKISASARGTSGLGILLNDGTLWYMRLAGPSRDTPVVPSKMSQQYPDKRISDFAMGEAHSVAVCDDGSVYTWGWNLYGQCGTGDTDDRDTPHRVTELDGIAVAGVYASAWLTLVRTMGGELYIWGWGHQGQLGLDTSQAQLRPRLLEALSDCDDCEIRRVAVGATHVLALTTDGRVFAWGDNRAGAVVPDGVTVPAPRGRDALPPSSLPQSCDSPASTPEMPVRAAPPAKRARVAVTPARAVPDDNEPMWQPVELREPVQVPLPGRVRAIAAGHYLSVAYVEPPAKI